MSNTLNGYINLAITQGKDGKYISYPIRLRRNENLSAFLAGISGIEHANVCTSAKGAKELCAFWNACYLANGTLLK